MELLNRKAILLCLDTCGSAFKSQTISAHHQATSRGSYVGCSRALAVSAFRRPQSRSHASTEPSSGDVFVCRSFCYSPLSNQVKARILHRSRQCNRSNHDHSSAAPESGYDGATRAFRPASRRRPDSMCGCLTASSSKCKAC